MIWLCEAFLSFLQNSFSTLKYVTHMLKNVWDQFRDIWGNSQTLKKKHFIDEMHGWRHSYQSQSVYSICDLLLIWERSVLLQELIKRWKLKKKMTCQAEKNHRGHLGPPSWFADEVYERVTVNTPRTHSELVTERK